MRPLGLRWTPATDLSEAVSRKYERILSEWKGTRYMKGVCGKGSGVDCVRWCCAVLSEMEGVEPREIKGVPQDAAFHSPETSWRAVRAIMRLFWPVDFVRDGSVSAGQMVVVGPRSGGPGHAMLASSSPGVVWHSINSRGVQRAAYYLSESEEVKAVLTIRDRDIRWQP